MCICICTCVSQNHESCLFCTLFKDFNPWKHHLSQLRITSASLTSDQFSSFAMKILNRMVVIWYHRVIRQYLYQSVCYKFKINATSNRNYRTDMFVWNEKMMYIIIFIKKTVHRQIYRSFYSLFPICQKINSFIVSQFSRHLNYSVDYLKSQEHTYLSIYPNCSDCDAFSSIYLRKKWKFLFN